MGLGLLQAVHAVSPCTVCSQSFAGSQQVRPTCQRQGHLGRYVALVSVSDSRLHTQLCRFGIRNPTDNILQADTVQHTCLHNQLHMSKAVNYSLVVPQGTHRTEKMSSRSSKALNTPKHGVSLPPPVVALPTQNNIILQRHTDLMHAFQQRLLEEDLRCQPGGSIHPDNEVGKLWLLGTMLICVALIEMMRLMNLHPSQQVCCQQEAHQQLLLP